MASLVRPIAPAITPLVLSVLLLAACATEHAPAKAAAEPAVEAPPSTESAARSGESTGPGQAAAPRAADVRSRGVLNAVPIPGAVLPPISGSPGTPPTLTIAPPPLRGWVDLHTHPLANIGFAGKLLYGGVDIGAPLPADPDCKPNVRASTEQQALGHDASTHGAWSFSNTCGDSIRQGVIGGFELANNAAPIDLNSSMVTDAHGYPDFKDWPVWNDITHQKMWVEWIRRAWIGGQRVLVALAVNNKTLADAVAGPGDGPDNDKASADFQIAEIENFVARHSDFMEVAKSSADVQRIVSANRLAVIVGMEVDRIGDFGQMTKIAPPALPTASDVVAEIDRVYAEGVRYIFPVHVLDNVFGATAAYESLFNISNSRETGHFWNLQCATPADNISWRPDFSPTGTIAAMFGASAKLSISIPLTGVPMPSCPAGIGVKNVGDPVTVNGMTTFPGLTALGRIALKEMMRLGMLIDVDHMSQNTMNSALDFAEQVLPDGTRLNYPVMSGHGHGRGSLPGAPSTSERDPTATQYQRIANLHGMIGVGSSNLDAFTWFNLYNNIISPFTPGMVGAFGTDTDGFATGMPPRVGNQIITIPNAARQSCIANCQSTYCGTNASYSNSKPTCSSKEPMCEATCKANNPPTVTTCTHCNLPPMPAVQYDNSFLPPSEGNRTWNYNTDGVVHYGMLADFLRDVASFQGGADWLNNQFMFGADYFYHTWQIAESRSAAAALSQ